MLSKRDERLLLKVGFEKEEESVWSKGDWSINESKKESKEIRDKCEIGYRICLMYDDGGSYV